MSCESGVFGAQRTATPEQTVRVSRQCRQYSKRSTRGDPGEIVFEDDRSFAFLDAEPTAVGHALVASKLVVDRVYDLLIPH